MFARLQPTIRFAAMIGLFFWSYPAGAQTITAPSPPRPLASNVIVPQTRSFILDGGHGAEITAIDAQVAIVEQVATTRLDIRLQNPGSRRLQAELLVPVPDGAVIRGFDFQGQAGEPSARILPRAEARRIYDEIVARTRDPALLEFAGYNLVRSSVFPIEPGGSQAVRLIYETLLAADGDRLDYLLPRSESVEYAVPWQISVKIRSKRPISTVYSPSHRISTTRLGPGEITVSLLSEARRDPGPFRLSCLLERNGVTASLLAYPDPAVGGGYFLLLAGLPATTASGPESAAIKREVTLVVDRSGSMQGGKIKQVCEAARQILAALEPGEAFNILAYNDSVQPLWRQPIVKSDAGVQEALQFIGGLNARGGTNIHDALLEALRPQPAEGLLPIVLFLTDGLPTVGQTSEVAIRDVAAKANPHRRRIFTFGVGVDVNAPLLDKIAEDTRAAATFVLPEEDVEAKVAQVFRRLSGPVLADPVLQLDADGPSPRVTDLLPTRLADLFEGDQLVVLGKYAGAGPLVFNLTGNYLGRPREFSFRFALDSATTANAFVPRLWASRRIASLIEAIRQAGANPPQPGHAAASPVDPRIKELVDEIVRLSTEFGILTEYTAFLAREGTNLEQRADLLTEANNLLRDRAMNTRSGKGAVSQSINKAAMGQQQDLNYRNAFVDQNMKRVQIAAVQQVADRAFFNRSGRWVDSRLVQNESQVRPSRVIEFGSDEFRALAERLAREGRQGTIALHGDILLMVGNEPVLVRGPAAAVN